MESNSICNHTSDNKIGRPRNGSPICLSRVWLQTELDGTKSYYQLIITITISEKMGAFHYAKRTGQRSVGIPEENGTNLSIWMNSDRNFRNLWHNGNSLQNRRISGASAIHERAREARGQKNPPVITQLFILFRPQTHPIWPANHSVRKTMVITARCIVGEILHVKLRRSWSHL